MRTRFTVLILLVAAAGTLAGCSSSSSSDTAADASSTTQSEPTTTSLTCAQGATNTAQPSFYQEQFNPQAQSLRRDIASYRSAVDADDTSAMQNAASTLYSEIASDATMAQDATAWGCYDPAVLQSLVDATNAVTPLFDNLNSALSGCCGHTAAEAPALIEQIKPKLGDYISAMDGYSAQFGGDRI